MKIAIVFDGLDFGGIEKVGLDYVKMLVGQGHTVDVYNLRPKENNMKNNLPNGVKYFEKKFGSALCPDKYAYGVKKWRWGKYAYPVIYPLVKLALYGKRLFSIRKKYDIALAFAGHFADLTFVAYNFVRAEKKLCWLHGDLASYLLITHGFGNLYRKIKNLVVLSEVSQEAALDGNKFLKLDIKKIYNPTYIKSKPLDEKKIARLKECHGDFLLNIARFSAQKDHKTILDALKILREQAITPKIVFVGGGYTFEEVKQYAQEAGVGEQCVFEGERDDVQNYYAAAKIFVHSSPSEGLPTTLIEALSMGLPIVATDSKPGVGELLQSKYGLTCPVGNPAEMAEGIFRLLREGELYAHYQKLSAQRAADFTPEKISSQLTALLEDL